MKTKSEEENDWVRFPGFPNLSRSHRANERIFHFDKSQSVWVCQCDRVTFFYCALILGMFQSVLKVNLGHGWGVGGKGRISQISMILSLNISVLVTTLYPCTSVQSFHWNIEMCERDTSLPQSDTEYWDVIIFIIVKCNNVVQRWGADWPCSTS